MLRRSLERPTEICDSETERVLSLALCESLSNSDRRESHAGIEHSFHSHGNVNARSGASESPTQLAGDFMPVSTGQRRRPLRAHNSFCRLNDLMPVRIRPPGPMDGEGPLEGGPSCVAHYGELSSSKDSSELICSESCPRSADTPSPDVPARDAAVRQTHFRARLSIARPRCRSFL